MLVIPATQEEEIRGIMVQSKPRQIVQEKLSRKYPSQKKKKKGASGVARGVGPEFKHKYRKKKKKKLNLLCIPRRLGNPKTSNKLGSWFCLLTHLSPPAPMSFLQFQPVLASRKFSASRHCGMLDTYDLQPVGSAIQ
jgi:hypothetical protein